MRKRHSNSKVSKKRAKQVLNAAVRKDQNVDELLAQLPAAGLSDTAQAIVEIYESVERSYRAAVMAGEFHPRVAQSTNY
jgi:hypothetical protein